MLNEEAPPASIASLGAQGGVGRGGVGLEAPPLPAAAPPPVGDDDHVPALPAEVMGAVVTATH